MLNVLKNRKLNWNKYNYCPQTRNNLVFSIVLKRAINIFFVYKSDIKGKTQKKKKKLRKDGGVMDSGLH